MSDNESDYSLDKYTKLSIIDKNSPFKNCGYDHKLNYTKYIITNSAYLTIPINSTLLATAYLYLCDITIPINSTLLATAYLYLCDITIPINSTLLATAYLYLCDITIPINSTLLATAYLYLCDDR